MSSNLIELECSACGKKYDASVEQHLCTCGKPLLARYDLKHAAGTFTFETLKDRPRTMWRYAEVLPDGKRRSFRHPRGPCANPRPHSSHAAPRDSLADFGRAAAFAEA